ncbi:hypothetical protein [Undibacterium pigrum]|uniref:DUF3828 domain-containing protein n=1 Tax=Undibacterium pigrum TaxID=401470 RepID=A0A318JCS9_9BURK|nr:hypothetical protein [Undibacterium pigrum]PXX44854.1 hypothetical protein DFR42_10266 [Undibacterium pigrum]
MKTSLNLILITALFSTAPMVHAGKQDEQALMAGVQGFYGWVLKNGKQVSALQPAIKDIPGSKKFQLDTKNLKAFSGKFMASGYFAADFPAALERYYGKYQQQFQAYTDAEFAQMAQDGRGPLMDTEDMDIFFCAQEYEYKPSFIRKIKAKSIKLDGDKASVIVVSPYQWETEFKFVKVGQRWLINGYCVFQ